MSDDIDIYGLPGESRDLSREEILDALASASNKIKGTGTLFGHALAAKLARRTPIIQKVPLKKERKWILGFGPFINVKPGAIEKIDIQAKLLFRGEKIINTGDENDLHLLGIFVGKQEILDLKGDSIPFSKLGNLDLPPVAADPALTMQIKFHNRSTESRTVSLSIVGKAVL